MFLVALGGLHCFAYLNTPDLEAPRIVAAYFFNDQDSKTTPFLNDPTPADSVLIAAFDLVKGPLTECEAKNFEGCIDYDRIRLIKERKLSLLVDIAREWGSGEDKAFFKDFNRVSKLLLKLIKVGADGINFDEYLYWTANPDASNPPINEIFPQQFQKFKSKAMRLNPNVFLIFTEVSIDLVKWFIAAGGRPDVIALAWYTVSPKTARSQFSEIKVLARKNKILSGFWVDPTSYDKTGETLDNQDVLLMWNLCWQGTQTCPDEPMGTRWLNWKKVKQKANL